MTAAIIKIEKNKIYERAEDSKGQRDWPCPGTQLSLICQHWDYRYTSLCPAMSMGSADLNLGSYV